MESHSTKVKASKSAGLSQSETSIEEGHETHIYLGGSQN